MHDRELIEPLRNLGRPTVAVVGDFMLDRYVWGDAGRVSPEAPVPVVAAHREETRLGGAGNVAANLATLGAKVSAFGAMGCDEMANSLCQTMQESGVNASGMQACDDRPTIQKIRVMARNQQMLRVDREEIKPLRDTDAEAMLAAICAADWSAIVLSDYGKGTLTPGVIQAVLAEATRRGAPSLVDPKHRDLSRYAGASIVTPNRGEAEVAICDSLSIDEPLDSIEALAVHGESMRQQAGLDSLLITLGAEGMLLLQPNHKPLHLPTAARQVFDVTGAGDTVIATLGMSMAARLPLEMATALANVAAGLAVSKVGTTPVGREELLQHLSAATTVRKVLLGTQAPAPEVSAVESALAVFRNEGLRVVFTNGCFDILHAGHVRYLQEAREMGDVLVIGLNDDDSVRRLKGAERPFNTLEDRAVVLAGLACVDLVIPFSTDTPEGLVQQVQPDVLVKGGDYRGQTVAGAEWVEKNGGEVQFVDLVPGRSTTGLADRIRTGADATSDSSPKSK
ncbi:MAG: D-glycero-beta-D-manno-heptose-7-phosphate kinase [Planctomycetes bacterium]|jgi:D-beta-D-heptose 7-phosphate kinase/D-beta-D-heptose 1-phosphate adenosyltransferase|nr:D-glycero-beta-D-manno-heptose-7-phosphate kinase [Planctomycetota bacterium]MBT4028787.1 D-glycero-beta-D-manno-heptose-7-phosphate kinase [Planctomycetota bacterium]MBT4559653.1 D-glycero-beta-D-manno-heptose-7-phosphate kinase [Planctomycetota bacterium]MBT5100474.1 D-glycero-beta-D-manno-heptose-7-phosphate kinase [Planctomycetota bacterium]MBT7317969.1 D-glycero-beta-D-manno-heptose-7-phosphate kinase [Planctomycetota bacterium]